MPRYTPKFIGAFCIALAATVVPMLGGLASAGDLSFIEDIPTDVLFGTVSTATGEASEGAQGSASSQGTFGFRNNATQDPAGTEGTRARGQSFTFTTGDGLTHEIGALSVSLNTPADDAGYRPNGQLELTVFQWDSNDPDDFGTAFNADDGTVNTLWRAGVGGMFGSGHVELFRESFPILTTDTWGNGDLVQIAFDPGELQLTDGTAYGFMWRYTLDELVDENGDPLDEDVNFTFDVRQDNDVPGALLSTNPSSGFATAPNNVSVSRDMNFFFTTPGGGGGLAGDLNTDGVVDCDDIDEFVGTVGQAANVRPELDLVADGTIDSADIALLVETLVVTSNGQTGTFLGDLNCDGEVNVLGDAFILVANLGNNSATSYGQGDINLDGVVNVLGDAFALVGNLGMSNTP